MSTISSGVPSSGADTGVPAEDSAPETEATEEAGSGLTAAQIRFLEDKYETATGQWLRKQAEMLAMDAYRYLVPETESQAMARIRRELARGKDVIPARILYRLALHFHQQARASGKSKALWDDEEPYLLYFL